MQLSPRLSSFDLSGARGDLALAVQAMREAGRPYFDLTVSNPTQAGLPYPGDRIRAALSGAAILKYRPDPRGEAVARRAVAGYYAERGWGVDVDCVTLTSGTSEAYSFLLKLLCGPGDNILVPCPSYPLLDYLLKLEDVEGICYPLRFSGGWWSIDFRALEAAITARTRGIVFVQPNNPTGNVLSLVEAQGLIAVAEKHGVPLIIDEVFCDYIFPPWEYCPVRSAGVPVFTLNGVSKVLALPQMKLSWILMEGDAGILGPVREGLEIIADTYLSVNTPVQAGLAGLMAMREGVQSAIRSRLMRHLTLMRERFLGHPALCPFSVQGGWYVVLGVDTGVSDETAAIALLREQGVYVHPGAMFGFPEGRYFVVSLLTPGPVFEEGLERLSRFGE